MNKILFISNTANFSKFNRPYMRWFRELGWQVDYCSAGEEKVLDCNNQYSISIARSPFSLRNVQAYNQLKNILKINNYSIVHCHTPMGGVIGRLAARKLWKSGKVKIIYTAHGFHFYKGAPLLNWLLYYPVEKWLMKYTDSLITINKEDFYRANKIKNKIVNIYQINGVGVNLEEFYPVKSYEEKINLRTKKGVNKKGFVLLYTAEFITRKNHKLIFDVLPELKNKIPELQVIFCGKGELLEYYKTFALINDLHFINFTGYTKDVADYCRLSDILIMPSLQEGLPMGMIEAIATGLPVVASNIRGHRDIIINNENGLLFQSNDKEDFKNKIIKLYESPELCSKISKENIIKAQCYSVDIVVERMAEIYRKLI